MSKIELDPERRNEEKILRAKEILLSELEKGRRSGETEGWLEADEVPGAVHFCKQCQKWELFNFAARYIIFDILHYNPLKLR